MNCSLPDSSVHGILKARILEWVAIPSPAYLPSLGYKPRSPALQADSLPIEPQGKPLMETVSDFIFLGPQITANGDCSHKIKRYFLLATWKNNYDKPRQCIKKQRHHFANTQFKSINSLVLSFVISTHDYWKNQSFD